MLMDEGWDRLVINGDLFEMWLYDYEEIADRHKELLAAIDCFDGEVVYVPGNHDGVFIGLRRLNDMRVSVRPFEFECGGRRFAITHGDEFDDTAKPISRVTAWLGALLDRIGAWFLGPGESVQRNVRKSFASMGAAREKYVAPFAEKAMAKLDADVVVIGHTHMPETREFEGRIYINDGDWGPEHMTYVSIEDGTPELLYAVSGS